MSVEKRKNIKSSKLVSFNYQKSPLFIVYIPAYPKLRNSAATTCPVCVPSIGNILLTASAQKRALRHRCSPRIFAFQCIGNLISNTATGNHIRHSLFHDFECSTPAARQSCNAILSARDTKMSTSKRHRLFASEFLFLEGKIAIWALFER